MVHQTFEHAKKKWKSVNPKYIQKLKATDIVVVLKSQVMVKRYEQSKCKTW